MTLRQHDADQAQEHRFAGNCAVQGAGLVPLRLIGLAVAAALFASMPARAADAPPLMTTPGAFDVSATGAATYTVPITVPPGTAGMAPALSLDYSSQNGDGIMGLGFALSGLSSITRCPQTVALDGVHGGVNDDANDRFCLDGQRLVSTGGTYGANNTEYGTYVDGFTKIVSYGNAGGGPAYFKAWTKSGTVMEFGNTADSQVLAQGKTVARLWALDKITDVEGNYLTVTYNSATGADRTTNGEVYPTRIDYTGHSTSPTSSPYNSVQFTYTSRQDAAPQYQAGAVMKTTVLLTEVETYTGQTLVSDYKIAYLSGASNVQRSKVSSIQLCDGSTPTQVCMPAVTFTWPAANDPVTFTQTSWQGTTIPPMPFVTGDFNGDGLSDIVSDSSGADGTITYWLATTTGSYTQNVTKSFGVLGKFVTGVTPAPIDLNGDGYTDVLALVTHLDCSDDHPWPPVCISTTDDTVDLNDGNGNQDDVVGDSYFFYVPVGDFNGDGREDALGDGTFYLSNGDGSFTLANIPGYVSATEYAGDFDGDGCTDILTQGGSDKIYYSCNAPTASATIPDWTGYTPVFGDFNGDGKTDVLLVSTTAAAKLELATGSAAAPFAETVLPSGTTGWGKYEVYAGDFNGDGKTDLALIAANTAGGNYGPPTAHSIQLSTGTGFVQTATIANASENSTADVDDFDTDGVADLWIEKTSTDIEYKTNYAPEMIAKIDNGLGIDTTITYDRMNKGVVYTKGTGAAYPFVDLNLPGYVVSRVDQGNGIGGTDSTTYAYNGAKAYQQGWGFLGFYQRIATDLQTHIKETTTYNQGAPYIGLVASDKIEYCPSGCSVTLDNRVYSYDAKSEGSGSTLRRIVRLDEVVDTPKDLDGSLLPVTITCYGSYDGSTCTQDYDDYGNPRLINQWTLDDGVFSKKITTNTYTNDTTNWILGQLTSSSVESIVGSSDITRASAFTHQSGTGLITREVIEPSTASLCLETDYTYDAYGNRLTKTVGNHGSGATCATDATHDIAPRTTTYTYGDGYHRFVTKIFGADGSYDLDQFAYNGRFGTLASHTDPDGLVTSWSVDGFGRVTVQTNPDTTEIVYTYAPYSSSDWPLLAFLRYATPTASDGVTQIGPSRRDSYDKLGRDIAVRSDGFSGACTLQTMEFDAEGRISRASRPYFCSGSTYPSGSPVWTDYTHDDLGRLTRTDFPDGSHSSASYSGLSSSFTDQLGHTKTSDFNAQLLVDEVDEPDGGSGTNTTAYTYDAFGDLKSVTDPLGNVIANTYDTRGRKTASADPDMGGWSYSYDVADELISQTDAKSQTASLTYDALGRVLTRNQAGTNGQYDVFTYGSTAASYNIGALIEEKSCSSSACSTVTSDRTLAYYTSGTATKGKPYTSTLAIDGSNYTFSRSYDSYGRLARLNYPSGYAVKYSYVATYGYLSAILDNGTSTPFWTANTRDAELHLTQETLGTGVVVNQAFDPNTGLIASITSGSGNAIANFSYTFDSLGNLTKRTDGTQSLSESFCYDSLNRLTHTKLAATINCSSDSYATSTTYDALGNIASKTQIGSSSTNTYAYPASGPSSVRPHAVSSIAGTVNGTIDNPTYSYDSNGNMTGGAGRTYTWTSFNLVHSIVQASTTLTYTYDAEHERVKQVDPNGTTYYFTDPFTGDVEEKYASGTTTWREYIMAPGAGPGSAPGLVAERSSVNGATTSSFFIGDSLGSSSVVLDSSGAVVQRLAYDAWGLRTDGLAAVTTRQFTGQEQIPIPGTGLLNYNARLYDPEIGRFLSADPTIPDPHSSQSLNRFSYVLNEPLSKTDPTGLYVPTGSLIPAYPGPYQGGFVNGFGYVAYGWQPDARSTDGGEFNGPQNSPSGTSPRPPGEQSDDNTNPCGPSNLPPPTNTAGATQDASSATGSTDEPDINDAEIQAAFDQTLDELLSGQSSGADDSDVYDNAQAGQGDTSGFNWTPLLIAAGVIIAGGGPENPVTDAAAAAELTGEAAEGVGSVATRALTETDLGLQEGSLQTLQGTYSVTNGTATVQVDMIQGTIGSPFSVIGSLSSTATADGAQTLTIQGTIGNERLFNILSGRYGLISQGSVDTITIPLGPGGS